MPKVNAGAIRRARSSELEELAQLLQRFGICDAHPLYSAAEECREGASKDEWGYNLANLVFRRPYKFRGYRPKGALDIQHVLDVSLTALFVEEGDDGDPLTSLAVDVVALGRSADDRPLLCSWHLDRHLQDAESEEDEGVEGHKLEDGEPGEIHPLYHVHFGGHRMTGPIDAEECNLGDILLLEPPRLAHPPLDAILAVDFLLSNYYPRDRRELTADGAYVRLIRTAQERLWRPYARITAQAWNPLGEELNWSSNVVWPTLPDPE